MKDARPELRNLAAFNEASPQGRHHFNVKVHSQGKASSDRWFDISVQISFFRQSRVDVAQHILNERHVTSRRRN